MFARVNVPVCRFRRKNNYELARRRRDPRCYGLGPTRRNCSRYRRERGSVIFTARETIRFSKAARGTYDCSDSASTERRIVTRLQIQLMESWRIAEHAWPHESNNDRKFWMELCVAGLEGAWIRDRGGWGTRVVCDDLISFSVPWENESRYTRFPYRRLTSLVFSF